MFKWSTIILICYLASPAYLNASEAPELYVGLDRNDPPFSSIDYKKRAKGLIVSYINSICKHLGRQCKYESNQYPTLINRLQRRKIHALAVNEHIIIPDIDKVLLTPSICQSSPVFIHKSDASLYLGKDSSMVKKTIGVKEDSSLHLYLIENYTESVLVKTYRTMESAVFDLYFDRIDAIFSDQAFYVYEILNSDLGNDQSEIQFTATIDETVKIPFHSMLLAFSEKEHELYAKVVKFMRSRKNIPNCTDLLNR